MSGTVTLEFLAGQGARILEELANMRADHAALLTIAQRMDATMTPAGAMAPEIPWVDVPDVVAKIDVLAAKSGLPRSTMIWVLLEQAMQAHDAWSHTEAREAGIDDETILAQLQDAADTLREGLT
jgi:hypothetical protein